MARYNLLMTPLRSGPIGLGVSAVAVLALGYYLHVSGNTQAAALATNVAGGMTVFGLFSKIAGAIGLLALAGLVFKPQAKAEAFPQEVEAPDAALQSTHITSQQRPAKPVLKHRSGLVSPDEMDAHDPAYTGASKEDADIVKPRRGFGLRKVMVGLVGGLFVLGLVSTVSGLIAKSAPVEVAQVQTIQQAVAAGVADTIVPDADPNRHWTDIDVTPIVEWFTAKFLLAVAGDVAAQLLLGMIFGGVIASLIAIRTFFVLRRALRPKTTANFSSMGIN